jgi:predicted solute-binding protein
LEIVPLEDRADRNGCEAVLLIGDKVVSRRPTHLTVETDLGQAWKSLTSLPFVFAVWAAPSRWDCTALAERLSQARDAGVRGAEMIAADFGPGMGWPVALAKRYLTARLKFTLTERFRAGMNKFLELARRHELIPVIRQPLESAAR